MKLYQAICIARDAHQNQVDKAGKPYIFHPLAVMLMVNSEEEMIVAVLHDVVEDTEVTLDDLKQAGASPTLLAAVDAITLRPDELYEVYLDRVRANPIAKRVKLADATHNSDPERLAQFESEEKRQKFEAKYRKVIALLEGS